MKPHKTFSWFLYIAIIFLLIACEPSPNEEFRAKVQWYESLRVGNTFENKYNAAIVEETNTFIKYRVSDIRIGHPDYMYVTTRDGKIIAIWAGRY